MIILTKKNWKTSKNREKEQKTQQWRHFLDHNPIKWEERSQPRVIHLFLTFDQQFLIKY